MKVWETDMHTMIEVKDLSKSFKTFKRESGLKGTVKSLFKREHIEVNAVKDVTFNIEKGEIIGYIGANGAGKSTTIKMMTGILTPTTGSVLVDGRVPYKERTENAKHIGVVFGQKTQLWWDLPLGETFSILKEIYQVPDQFYKDQMAYFDEIFELSEFMNQTVRTLSLGQRMRADLAASMLHNPKVLFLDEPTIGLDVVVKERIRKAVKEMNAKYGTTIILTTHDMSDIEQLCSRIIIIDKGELLYDGGIDMIRQTYGYERRLIFDLRYDDGKAVRDKLDLLMEDMEYITEESLTYNLEKNKLEIVFDRNQINISSITNLILQNFDVLDFSLKDMDIEEIVKKIAYSK